MIASLVVLLYLSGMIPAETAIVSLYAATAFLIIGEVFVFSFGILTLNAALAFYAGYVIQTGHNFILGIPVDWPLLFGIVLVELIVIAAFVFVYLKFRRHPATTGTEGMVGEEAEIVKWEGQNGSVRVQGEVWSAYSDAPIDSGSSIVIETVEKLKVKVKAKEL